MTIEILYPQLCTLYGDKGNMQYLKKCLPDAKFVETNLNDKPLFLTKYVDMVYICSMSEQSQEVILSRLLPYKEEIKGILDDGQTLFFMTGNALELLGKYIKREDGTKVEGLAYLNSYSVRQTPNRFNTLMKARFESMILLGYSSRFSHTFGISEKDVFCDVLTGYGMNPKSKKEGISKGSILATYMLGPILVSNPDFTHYLLRRLDADMEKLPFEDAMRDAYNRKLEEFSQPDLELS
ncbi:MAG: hypothetical protein ACI4EK_03940 [Wujia sp.]